MDISRNKSQYWFPAKKYGWGWGLPNAWQGWFVLSAFVALFCAGTVIISPATHPAGYLLYCLGLSGVLIGICYIKGEPPGWRWGK